MKKYLFVFTFVLLTSLSFSLVQIDVSVEGKTSGFVDYINYTRVVNNSAFTFSANWYNSGSVICEDKLRIDIENKEKINTLWSSKQIVKPGGFKLFTVYWYPSKDINKKTNLTLHAKLYHCYEVLDLGEFNFTVYPENLEKFKESPVKVSKIDKSGIILNKNKNVDSVVITPEKYPSGWYFETKKAENKTTKLQYETDFWKEETAEINILASVNGSLYHNKLSVDIKETKTPVFVYFLILFFVLVVFLLVYFFSKRK